MINFFASLRYSFFLDNVLFVFTYIFILNTNLFWDYIFCEKLKKLYDSRSSLETHEEIREVEYSYVLACKALQKKKALYNCLIRFYILAALTAAVFQIFFYGHTIAFQKKVAIFGTSAIFLSTLTDIFMAYIYTISVNKFFNLLRVRELKPL